MGWQIEEGKRDRVTRDTDWKWYPRAAVGRRSVVEQDHYYWELNPDPEQAWEGFDYDDNVTHAFINSSYIFFCGGGEMAMWYLPTLKVGTTVSPLASNWSLRTRKCCGTDWMVGYLVLYLVWCASAVPGWCVKNCTFIRIFPSARPAGIRAAC